MAPAGFQPIGCVDRVLIPGEQAMRDEYQTTIDQQPDARDQTLPHQGEDAAQQM